MRYAAELQRISKKCKSLMDLVDLRLIYELLSQMYGLRSFPVAHQPVHRGLFAQLQCPVQVRFV